MNPDTTTYQKENRRPLINFEGENCISFPSLFKAISIVFNCKSFVNLEKLFSVIMIS